MDPDDEATNRASWTDRSVGRSPRFEVVSFKLFPFDRAQRSEKEKEKKKVGPPRRCFEGRRSCHLALRYVD